jgi:hypothetical protein
MGYTGMIRDKIRDNTGLWISPVMALLIASPNFRSPIFSCVNMGFNSSVNRQTTTKTKSILYNNLI